MLSEAKHLGIGSYELLVWRVTSYPKAPSVLANSGPESPAATSYSYDFLPYKVQPNCLRLLILVKVAVNGVAYLLVKPRQVVRFRKNTLTQSSICVTAFRRLFDQSLQS